MSLTASVGGGLRNTGLQEALRDLVAMNDKTVLRSDPRSEPHSGMVWRAAVHSPSRVLLIGLMKPAPGLLAQALMVHSQFRHLTSSLLAEVRPDTVVAPLIASGWDVTDVAEVLHDHGYRGPLMVLTRPLPRADLVRTEIEALFPGIALGFLAAA